MGAPCLLPSTAPSCSCGAAHSRRPKLAAISSPSSIAASGARLRLACRRRTRAGVARAGGGGGGEGEVGKNGAAAFFGEDGVVEDMDGYLNHLSLEYDSVWDTKPPWVQFTEFIQKNLHLYQFRNNIPLTTAATANFTRGELATALRKNPYFVNIILAGYDKDAGASMYYIDYIATLHKIDKGAFGYGSYFCLSLMDKLYHPDMTVEEAVDLVDKCIKEIRLRLVVAPPNFVIKIVDKDGAREYVRGESIGDNPSEAATTTAA